MTTTITREVRNGRTVTVYTEMHSQPELLPAPTGCTCPLLPVYRFDKAANTVTPVRDHHDLCFHKVGPQYGPNWIATCYGVSVTDPCPTVTLGK